MAVVLAAGAAALAQPSAPAFFNKVRITQKLNSQVPLEVLLADEDGRPVRLGQYFRGRPVVLALVYYQCTMLCNQTLNGLTRAMQSNSLQPGEDYDVVTVSFDARETYDMARAKKHNYIEKLNRPGASEGWHFLTGNAVNVRRIADSVGFAYVWDSMTNQFAHASGIMVLTPDGRVSKYFYGIEYKPRDFRLGLVDASESKIGTPVDQLLLMCFHYDPATGKYGFVAMRALRVAGALSVFGIVALVLVLRRRERHPGPAGVREGRLP